MAIKGIDHVVIRVKDIDVAIESYKNLGMELTKSLETPGIGKQAVFRLADGTFIELVAPLSPDSPIGRAIEKRGEGVHTVALAVDDVEKTEGELKAGGAQIIPADDMDGVFFVHPKSAHGVLLQVMEKKS